MRSLVRRSGAALLLAVAILVAVTGPATAAPSAGVDRAPTAAPSSGYNDWSCKPSAEHPRPVVLMHGLGANPIFNFSTLGPRIAGEGYCVFAETYGTGALGPVFGGLAPVEKSAAQLGDFVDRLRATTGSDKVDIVGWSLGTTVPAYYLKFLGGNTKVDKFVGFGSNFRGTAFAGIGALAQLLNVDPALPALGCPACQQLLTGSEFIMRLNQGGGVIVPGPKYTSIVSRSDRLVLPYTNGLLNDPRGTDIVLQDRCKLDSTGHTGLGFDPNVGGLVLEALDPEGADPVRCVPFTSPI